MLAGKNGHAQCVAVLLYIGSRILMKLVFLSAEFYKDYADCSEIEQKPTRPYIRIGVLINGVLWAVPFRSNIRHEHVIWTNEAKRCGMDFSKAVVIVDPERYIDSAVPHLRGEEFTVLKTINAHAIEVKMAQFIGTYKKAKRAPNVPRNKRLLTYSTLQYFEEYIPKDTE